MHVRSKWHQFRENLEIPIKTFITPEKVNFLLFLNCTNFWFSEEPKAPYLLIDGRRLDAGNSFVPIKENNDLSVECVVEGGNPKPKLSWLLMPSSNNIDVSAGVVAVPGLQIFNESLPNENAAVHLFRIEAKLPKVLRAHHNSTIICIVNHVTLQTPLNTSILLDVQCKYLT